MSVLVVIGVGWVLGGFKWYKKNIKNSKTPSYITKHNRHIHEKFDSHSPALTEQDMCGV